MLWKAIVETACRSANQLMAMDALRQLRNPNADLWQSIVLKHYKSYLSGADAPDKTFKDYKNHVLYVNDNDWGGAIQACQLWYERLLLAMRKGYWPDVAYSAGVLSHYFTDPHLPFHTAQSEEEGRVHGAVDLSLTYCYAELQEILEQDLGGYPTVALPTGKDWLGTLLKRGAQLANAHYFTLIEHYDLKRGVKDPQAGFDQECKDVLAALIGQATAGFATVFDRAATESGKKPPLVTHVLETVLATAKYPVRLLTRGDEEDDVRASLERMHDESRKTGKVIASLSDDDRHVRRLYAEQVLKVPTTHLDNSAVRPSGHLHGTGTPARDHSDAHLLSGPISPRMKLRPAKIENPLLKQTRRTWTALSSVANRQPYASLRGLKISPTTTPSEPTDVSPLADEVSEVGSSVPAESSLANAPVPVRRKWFKKPDFSGLKQRFKDGTSKLSHKIKNSRLGRFVGHVRALPSRFKLRPLGSKATAEPTDEANSTPENLDHSQPTRTVKVNVLDDLTPISRSGGSPTTAGAKYLLDNHQPLANFPTIGAKMAKRFEGFGVRTVGDFLDESPDDMATKLGIKTIDANVLTQWQMQAMLLCRVPDLRGSDAQLLVGSGVTNSEELASLDERDLLELVSPYAASTEGLRILRNGHPPDLDQVRNWINSARRARAA